MAMWFLAVGLLSPVAAQTPVGHDHVATGCHMDRPGTTYIGGNLHDKYHPNTTQTPPECCALCLEIGAGCVFWTWSPTCWGNTTGCCWLKSAQAWVGRRVDKAGHSYSGSTHPLPPVPPVPPPKSAVYKCVSGVCVKTGPPRGGVVYYGPSCNNSCAAEVPVLSKLRTMRMQMLPVGDVVPTGWLKMQLATQVNGLSGHLQRFWPDVRNSSWLHPENRWQETYSDRGGNLPYWLNGV